MSHGTGESSRKKIFPSGLQEFLSRLDTPPKKREINQDSLPTEKCSPNLPPSMAESPQNKISPEQRCYQRSKVEHQSRSCYEMPAEIKDGKNDESIYELPKWKDLNAHRKNLLALKKTEHEPTGFGCRDFIKIEERSTPKAPISGHPSLKRSLSVVKFDEGSPTFTPKRARVVLDTPRPVPTHRRKSFPFTPQHYRHPSTPSYHRRHSFRSSDAVSYDASILQDLDSDSGFIDSHCHLDFLFNRIGYTGTYAQFREEVGFPKCYKGCLAIFCRPQTFGKEFLWGHFLKEENVWASFGCHPHNAEEYNDYIENDLCAALDHPKVRALGEIGLDYSNRNNCNKEKQFEAFRRQLRIALQRKLPVVLHCRQAHDDGIAIVQEILPSNYPIHLHCFTDTWEVCQRWLQLFPRLCVGLTSVLSIPNASDVRHVAQNLPLDRLLLETDAPFFVPRISSVPITTRHSHPGMAIHVAAQVAALQKVPMERVLEAARTNTRRIYHI